MEEFINRRSALLRWLVLLPGIPVVFFGGNLAIELIGKVMVFIGPRSGWGENFFDYVIGPGVAGYWTVRWVFIAAPNAKRAMGFAITCAFMVTGGFIAVIGITVPNWPLLLGVASLVVGTAMGYDSWTDIL